VSPPSAPVPDERDRAPSSPPDEAEVLEYLADLAGARDFAAAWARRVGLTPHRVGNLVIVVGELTANTLAHTGGPGVLSLDPPCK
jgi:anti-sigma regulatory factor (Ser/Thr protein kinase)